MGEVYRAKDLRLGREVAVKVLPQHLSASPEVRARFEREARTVSSLNHPHICTLFDVGREGDTDYLVMELLEGETLGHRLARGALPAVEVLRLGAQIADALDRAHRADVVHRDLKPGNVMLTKSGAKLMDFGLARASGLAGASGGSGSTVLAQSPTRAAPLTSEGAIIGTLQYMAPEQLEAKETDARADLWALGCVLYEMATGKRAFEGASQASLISSIMKDEPRPMGDLAPLAPPALDRLIRQCLAKDPEQRLQSAHDVKLHLDWIRDAGSQVAVPAPDASRRHSRERLAWIAALTIVILGAAAAVLLLRGPGTAPLSLHASLPPPPGTEYSSSITNPLLLAISADGARIAFCARQGEGADLLWARSLDSPEARALAGTEDAMGPFFSPDGRSIGFFAGGKLKRVDFGGGPIVTLADAPDPRGATWGRDGVIVFAPNSETPLFQVSADGGPVTPATVLDSTLAESTHRYPRFLPDGRRFLYLARRAGAGAGREPAIYAGDLGSSKRTRVAGVASNVQYASGHLLYVQGGILQAQAFDPARLSTKGPAVPLVDNLLWDERFSRGIFSASQNGVLACMTGKTQTRTQLAWLDRSGRRLERIGEPADYTYGGTPALSPDGQRAAMAILNTQRGNSDIWIIDLASGRRRRLTVDDADHPGCAWSQDSQWVFLNRLQRGTCSILRTRADGSGAADTLHHQRGYAWPTSGSADGRFCLVGNDLGLGGSDLMARPVSGGPTIPVTAGPGYETVGQFSPNGRWVAYASDETGRSEIYVVSFPESGGKWQVSQDGGREPRWNRNGKELLYVDRDNRIVAVEVDPASSSFETGAITPLFQLHATGGFWRYDIAPDGARFLVTVPPDDEAPPSITLLTNWTAKLQNR